MNAKFAKFYVALNSPMIEVASVNRDTNRVQTDYPYLYPELQDAKDFQDVSTTLLENGFVPVKDNFSPFVVPDIREACKGASDEFKQIFEESLAL